MIVRPRPASYVTFYEGHKILSRNVSRTQKAGCISKTGYQVAWFLIGIRFSSVIARSDNRSDVSKNPEHRDFGHNRHPETCVTSKKITDRDVIGCHTRMQRINHIWVLRV